MLSPGIVTVSYIAATILFILALGGILTATMVLFVLLFGKASVLGIGKSAQEENEQVGGES